MLETTLLIVKIDAFFHQFNFSDILRHCVENRDTHVMAACRAEDVSPKDVLLKESRKTELYHNPIIVIYKSVSSLANLHMGRRHCGNTLWAAGDQTSF